VGGDTQGVVAAGYLLKSGRLAVSQGVFAIASVSDHLCVPSCPAVPSHSASPRVLRRESRLCAAVTIRTLSSAPWSDASGSTSATGVSEADPRGRPLNAVRCVERGLRASHRRCALTWALVRAPPLRSRSASARVLRRESRLCTAVATRDVIGAEVRCIRLDESDGSWLGRGGSPPTNAECQAPRGVRTRVARSRGRSFVLGPSRAVLRALAFYVGRVVHARRSRFAVDEAA
jgi:hypothetical protein